MLWSDHLDMEPETLNLLANRMVNGAIYPILNNPRPHQDRAEELRDQVGALLEERPDLLPTPKEFLMWPPEERGAMATEHLLNLLP